MKKSLSVFALFFFVGAGAVAHAAPLTFNATGHPDVSGSVTFDDTNLLLNGSCESNASITNLDLSVTVGQDTTVFTTADVVTDDFTVLISTGPLPQIENGCGNLAINGGWVIGFWPDGWDGSPTDGDASLRVQNSGQEIDVSYAVLWEIAEFTPSARFNVTKTFTNGDAGDVEVTLTCNGGIPLQQSFTISGGDPAGVTFVVTELPDTGVNCEVTESGGNEGYTADLSACSWTGVTGGSYSCPIENVPEATTVSVDTTVDTDGDATIDPTFTTTIVCQNVSPDTGPNFGTVTVTNTDGMFEADWYADPVNGTDCTVTMVPNASAVEGDSCSFSFDIGDEEAGCDVAGTVFFEGIPTLSQYGLAIMALLMLGIGFVGFRRFV